MNSTEYGQALGYFGTLFAPYVHCRDLFVELRTLAVNTANDGRPPREWYPLTAVSLEAAAKTCVLWANRWNVHVSVLPREGRGGKAEHVKSAAWLWADIDGCDQGPDGAKRLLTAAGLPEPNIIVMSGNGLHVYWMLSEVVALDSGEARDRFKALLQRLAKAIGGVPPASHSDLASAEVARLLRPPGTTNHRRGRAVKLLHCDPNAERRPLVWWRGNLPALPAPPQPKTILAPSLTRMQSLVNWARRPYPEGERHRDLAAAAKWLIQDINLPKDIAEVLLLIKARASAGAHPITDAEVRGIVKWA